VDEARIFSKCAEHLDKLNALLDVAWATCSSARLAPRSLAAKPAGQARDRAREKGDWRTVYILDEQQLDYILPTSKNCSKC